jgi:hypothetical protein
MNQKLANCMKIWKGNGNTTNNYILTKDLKFYTKKEEDE